MGNKPYVYITRKIPEKMIQRLREVAEVGMWEHEDIPVPRQVLLQEVEKAQGLFVMLSDKIDAEVINRGTKLKVVANFAVGYDNIDIETATKRGIAVSNTPDILRDTTADLTFSLVLMTGRRLIEASDCVRTGKWTSWAPFFMAGTDIHHKTIGIVGMGNIGTAVAKRAQGFDMKVLYYNRNRKLDVEERLNVEYRPFDELIQESDYVVCLTPLNESTRHLFNKQVFKNMKNSAFFINASRGAVVVEEDLLWALKEGEIAGAGLDVFTVEPVNPNHPLLALPNVVALPHIGSASYETREAMGIRCCENIELVLTGKKPINLVNKEIYS